MPIELLGDIIEQLADRIGVYGAHDISCTSKKPCRVCWTSDLTDRIEAAIETSKQLERGFRGGL